MKNLSGMGVGGDRFQVVGDSFQVVGVGFKLSDAGWVRSLNRDLHLTEGPPGRKM
jgi:hypothetical protein